MSTQDMDSLLSAIFSVKHLRLPENETERVEKANHVMKTLVHIHSQAHRFIPDESPDQVVQKILKKLKRVKLGISSETSTLLQSCINDEEVGKLIQELEEISKTEAEIWTEEHVNKFRNEQRRFINKGKAKRHDNFVNIQGRGFIEEKDIPDDIKGMERLQNVVIKRGGLSFALIDKLTAAYLKEGEPEKARKLIDNWYEEKKIFPKFATIETLVDHYIEKGNLSEAINFVNSMFNEGGKVFGSTITKLGCAIGREKGHKELLSFVSSLNADSIVGKTLHDLSVFYGDIAENAEQSCHTRCRPRFPPSLSNRSNRSPQPRWCRR